MNSVHNAQNNPLNLGLPTQERLHSSLRFREIYQRGQSIKGPRLSIFFMPNQLTLNRLGLSVAKKRFKLSNHRQYVRRRLREAYRLNKMRFQPGFDIIVQAKQKALFKDLSRELLFLAQKAGLLKQDET